MPELQLDLSRPQSQRLAVRIALVPRLRTMILALPRWTPGSYLLREYVGHLEGLRANQNGSDLVLKRRSPFAWQLEGLEPDQPLELSYALQATELTVRTCHLNADHGFLALAAVVLELEGERWAPHRLQLLLPHGWQGFVPLPRQADGSWLAADFDQLIDAPVEAGPHPCHHFEVAGVPHRWVSWGGDLPAEDANWLADVNRVAQACCRLMGVSEPAASDYLFVLHLSEQGYGGLEHDASTVLQFGRRTLRKPEGRRRLLQLVAHEYLHQWNVRRLRPAELAPIDYHQAVVVPTLWFAEGVTSYVDQLLPHAAGCCDAADVLADLGADLSRYKQAKGRFVQSLQASSEEAWVKLYRPHPHAPNQQVSYYLKGAVLALVLDLHLRGHGSWIGAVLQQLWRSHGACRRGYQQADLLAAFAAHAPDLADLLPQWLASTDDPPLEAMLTTVGLKLVPVNASHPSIGAQLEARAAAGVWVARIERDGPAQQAGLEVGDELLALDGERVRSLDDWTLLLGDRCQAEPQRRRDLLICRDGVLRSLVVHAQAPGIERWQLEVDPDAPAAAADRRQAWLLLQP
ncbi:MAG: PDZ domain-containing protein [Cyanobacteriota bacterium]|nr:PDZ domain-containing protein [Cyanobacteriota bacterium]